MKYWQILPKRYHFAICRGEATNYSETKPDHWSCFMTFFQLLRMDGICSNRPRYYSSRVTQAYNS